MDVNVLLLAGFFGVLAFVAYLEMKPLQEKITRLKSENLRLKDENRRLIEKITDIARMPEKQ
jgi:hypothetical protein